MQRLYGEWQVSSNENTGGITYTCGFCNNSVCPPRKYVCLDNEYPRNATAFVFVCTSCNRPSFISINTIEQVPGKQYGSEINSYQMILQEFTKRQRIAIQLEHIQHQVYCAEKY